ncbi:hypothetical protein V491_01579, partial [Pseudogymnoascus sp. VKM F-3775]
MDMGSAAGVVTGEDCGKLGDTIELGGLETAEEGLVDVGSVAGITVTASDNTRVDASGVAICNDFGRVFREESDGERTPEVNHAVDNRLA